LTKCFRMRSLEEVPFSTTIDASPYRARASHPSAPLKEATRLLLDVASTPPVSGGEWSTQFIHTFYDRPVFRFVDLREEALIERPYKKLRFKFFGNLLIHVLEGIPQ
jgi:hypothetical protein